MRTVEERAALLPLPSAALVRSQTWNRKSLALTRVDAEQLDVVLTDIHERYRRVVGRGFGQRRNGLIARRPGQRGRRNEIAAEVQALDELLDAVGPPPPRPGTPQ